MDGIRPGRHGALTPLLAGSVIAITSCAPHETADLILTNANVITVDEALPRAEAVAIKGNRILAIGARQAVEPHAGAETEIIDLDGATVVPGLIDAHMHFPRLGKRTKQLFLDETRSPTEAIAVVKEKIASTTAGEWVTGQGWHTVMWGMSGFPDNSELDAASPENPVYLVGMASHAAWVNDQALEIAGITAETPDPPGGEIVRSNRGKPTGVLRETAMDLVSRHLPEETRASRKADIELSITTALAMGLTEVHDAGVGYEEIDIYKELLEEGKLDIRLNVMFGIPDAGEVLDRYIANPPEVGLGEGRLTLRSLKIFADGALGARGAALLEPYADSPEEIGLLQADENELYEVTRKAMEAGFQVAAHAIGDRANRIVLDAFERAQKERPADRPRHRIEHAQVIAPEDIPRFAELGVIPSMQPIHATMDMGFAEARVGPGRIRGAYAWRSLVDSGALIVASADTPAFPVKYSNPLWGYHAAVTRQDASGNPPEGWYPSQTLNRLEALKIYTINAAYAAFEEDDKGTLAPGKLADFTVLSKDILTIPAPEILETEVLMTLVDGRIVWRKP
ncbi:MAG TPA: amidohydrolase [Vicinamibacteria bacterium]|nr:amidohydrolase [Vicinamibacteria bacterium]